MKKVLSILLVVALVFSLCIFTVSAEPKNLKVFVAADGTGDFNCDGINDEVEINQALQFVLNNPDYSTVYLKSGKYVIDNTLWIGSNTILTGDQDTLLTIKDGAIWPKYRAMIQNINSFVNGPVRDCNITIHGFKIDGNNTTITQGINPSGAVVPITRGQEYYNMLYFKFCDYIDVYDMYLGHNENDGLYLNRCTNVNYYNCFIDEIGHDGLYANYSTDIKAYNNRIICRCNSGLRLYQSNKVKFYNNVIDSNGSGSSAIEIQRYGDTYYMDDIEIYDNTMYNTVFAAIWIFGGQGSVYSPEKTFINVHGNKILNTGTRQDNLYSGGIVANGFNMKINDNVIDGCYDVGIAIRKTNYATLGTGYQVTIKNNTITNTRYSVEGVNGYGIYNAEPGKYTVNQYDNVFANNPGGDYAEYIPAP